jgi:hypothetical protein
MCYRALVVDKLHEIRIGTLGACLVRVMMVMMMMVMVIVMVIFF